MDLIERDSALEIVRRTSGDYAAAFAEIGKLPTVDAAPVVHARWESYHESDFGWDEYGVQCTHCGLQIERGKINYLSRYCPRCGSIMDGKGT